MSTESHYQRPRATMAAALIASQLPAPLDQWTTADVSQFLENIDLTCYRSLFESHSIDGWALQVLSSSLLKDIGVSPVGHRLRLLREINALACNIASSGSTGVTSLTVAPSAPTFSSINSAVPTLQAASATSVASSAATTAPTPEGFQNFKIRREETCNAILPEALKRYNIDEQDWPSYALCVVCSDGLERPVAPDERPLEQLERFATLGKNPALLLRRLDSK